MLRQEDLTVGEVSREEPEGEMENIYNDEAFSEYLSSVRSVMEAVKIKFQWMSKWILFKAQ